MNFDFIRWNYSYSNVLIKQKCLNSDLPNEMILGINKIIMLS
jgi:hypothetical protein